MNDPQVRWTSQAVLQAKAVRTYLVSHFSRKEAKRFDEILAEFESSVMQHPWQYPAFESSVVLRKAVLHKNLLVFYAVREGAIIIVTVQDSRSGQVPQEE